MRAILYIIVFCILFLLCFGAYAIPWSSFSLAGWWPWLLLTLVVIFLFFILVRALIKKRRVVGAPPHAPAAAHAGHDVPKSPPVAIALLWVMFTMLFVGVVWMAVGAYNSLPTKKTTTQGSGSVQVERPQTPKRFKLVSGEELKVPLGISPKIYPKGGCMEVITPSGREIHDCPGIDSSPEENAGIYIFRRVQKGQSATEVEIWDRW